MSKNKSKKEPKLVTKRNNESSIRNVTESATVSIENIQKSVIFAEPQSEPSNLQISSGEKVFSQSNLTTTFSDPSISSSDSEYSLDFAFAFKRKDKKKDKGKKKKKMPAEEIGVKTEEKREFLGKESIVKDSKAKMKKKKEETKSSNLPDKQLRETLLEQARAKMLPHFVEESLTHTPTTLTTVTMPSIKSKRSKRGRKETKVGKEIAKKLKAEQEQEAARKAEAEKQRIEREKQAAIERVKREGVEQELREEQLEESELALKQAIEYNAEIEKQQKEQEEWEFYIKCGKLPNVGDCAAMTTYIHLWDDAMEKTTVEDASERTKDVIELLERLEDFIDSFSPKKTSIIGNAIWIYYLLRHLQQESLVTATLNLIKNIKVNMNRVDPATASYEFQDDYMILNLWTNIPWPEPLPNPRRPVKPKVDITFPNLNMQMLFPLSIPCDGMIVRVMYLKYDHLSDLCDTYYLQSVSKLMRQTLLESVKEEWNRKCAYTESEGKTDEVKKDISLQYIATKEFYTADSQSLEKQASKVSLTGLSPSNILLLLEYLDFKNEKDQYYLKFVHPSIINLRKYVILGGVYFIDLLYQPKQPQHFVTLDLTVTDYSLPKNLQYAQFEETIKMVRPRGSMINTATRSSSIIRASLPGLFQDKKDDMEPQLTERLISITMNTPKHVIFFEPPTICAWDYEEKEWTTDDISNVEYENETVRFKIEAYGAFAFAAFKYSLLPYRFWQVSYEEDNTVFIQIETQIISLYFRINKNLIRLERVENTPNGTVFASFINTYMKLHKLERYLKEIGVDIFPELDTIVYVENNSEKHWAMEKHLYFDMASVINSFNFASSKWNFQAGFRSIIVQMKEMEKSSSLLLVTPLKAAILDKFEWSHNMTLDEVETFKFSADLGNLIKATCGIAVRKRIKEESSLETVLGLYNFLVDTRFFSYS